MIYVNGCPKTGTHALQKALGLLAVSSQQLHAPYPRTFDGPHLCIFRHPRNVLISWVRWQRQPVSTGTLLLAMDEFNHSSFVDQYRSYLPWLKDLDTHCVRFEELLADDTVLRGIAKHLGVRFQEDAFEVLPGISRTWSGRLSDWREHWNDQIDAKWRKVGAQALQDELGYG